MARYSHPLRKDHLTNFPIIEIEVHHTINTLVSCLLCRKSTYTFHAILCLKKFDL